MITGRRWPGSWPGVEKELSNLASAIAAGGDLGTLLAAVRDRERARAEIRRDLAASEALRSSVAALSGARLRRDLARHLDDWPGLLQRRTGAGRQILTKLFVTRLAFEPTGPGRWAGRRGGAPRRACRRPRRAA